MARDLNKVQMTGRLGADPEMRYTPQGHAVTTFRAASNRSWRTAAGEAHEDTEWFRVVAWNKLAEICNQWLSKGSRVYVEGRLQTRKWTDKEGVERYTTEIVADSMQLLGGREGGGGGGGAEEEGGGYSERSAPAPRSAPAARPAPQAAARPAPQKSSTGFDNMDDDIPF